MAVSVGRLRPCSILHCKSVLLGHNTVRGAAGGAIHNAELLGPSLNESSFLAAYEELNQARYPFTADNQDYLAYICLVLGAGLFALEGLVQEFQAGTLVHFLDLLAQVQGPLSGRSRPASLRSTTTCGAASRPTPRPPSPTRSPSA